MHFESQKKEAQKVVWLPQAIMFFNYVSNKDHISIHTEGSNITFSMTCLQLSLLTTTTTLISGNPASTVFCKTFSIYQTFCKIFRNSLPITTST